MDLIQLQALDLGSASMTTKRVLLSSQASTQIVAANANRRFLAIVNNFGASVYLGSSTSMTEATSIELPTGAAANISRLNEQYTGAVWGRSGSAVTTLAQVSYMEV